MKERKGKKRKEEKKKKKFFAEWDRKESNLKPPVRWTNSLPNKSCGVDKIPAHLL